MNNLYRHCLDKIEIRLKRPKNKSSELWQPNVRIIWVFTRLKIFKIPCSMRIILKTNN